MFRETENQINLFGMLACLSRKERKCLGFFSLAGESGYCHKKNSMKFVETTVHLSTPILTS